MLGTDRSYIIYTTVETNARPRVRCTLSAAPLNGALADRVKPVMCNISTIMQ